jgi:hypothetical protein
VLFCVSLGLEMLTPVFPHHFLFLATLANMGKSISLAAYLATSVSIPPPLPSFLAMLHIPNTFFITD